MLAELAETVEVMGRARAIMNDIILKLYGPARLAEISRCSNVVPIGFHNLYQMIRRDLIDGVLYVENGQVCHISARTAGKRERCVPRKNILLAVDMYYEALGKRRRLFRDLEVCEL